MVKYKVRPRRGANGLTYRLDMTLSDGSRYRPSFKSKEQAIAEGDRMTRELSRQSAAVVLGVHLQSTSGAMPVIKLADAIRKHIKIKSAEIRVPENVRAFKYIQKYIYDGLFDLGIDFVHQITLEKVQLLRVEWKKKGHSNTTVNKRVASLRSLLNQCIGWDYIEKNPCDRLKPLPDDTKIREPWSFEEFKAIHGKLPGWCKDLVAFLWDTGCRPIEAIRLVDEDLSFLSKSVILRSGKGGGSSRRLPLTDGQIEFLEGVLAKRAKKFPFAKHIFTDDRGGMIYRNRVSDHVAAARKACEIKKQLVPYGTRHGFITRLQELNVAFGKVQALAGHKRAETTRGYTHLADDSLRQVMNLAEERTKRRV